MDAIVVEQSETFPLNEFLILYDENLSLDFVDFFSEF